MSAARVSYDNRPIAAVAAVVADLNIQKSLRAQSFCALVNPIEKGD